MTYEENQHMKADTCISLAVECLLNYLDCESHKDAAREALIRAAISELENAHFTLLRHKEIYFRKAEDEKAKEMNEIHENEVAMMRAMVKKKNCAPCSHCHHCICQKKNRIVGEIDDCEYWW